jgi:two-component system response regulator FixJ
LAVQAIKAGALDIIEKPFANTVLLDKVRKAVSASIEFRNSNQLAQSLPQRSSTLSVREHQVLKLTIAGYSSKKIARQLGGSPRTVETHRANIMKKMGVKRLSALVQLSTSDGD